jgi:hypothetical protein
MTAMGNACGESTVQIASLQYINIREYTHKGKICSNEHLPQVSLKYAVFAHT